MRAVLCKELGPPDKLVVENIASLKAGKGQVVVSVRAAGVNFPDTLIIQGKYQFKPEPPFSPGGRLGAGILVGALSAAAAVALARRAQGAGGPTLIAPAASASSPRPARC